MKLTIRQKLIGGFSLVLILLASIIGIAFSEITKVDEIYGDLINDKAGKLLAIKELDIAIRKEQNAIRGYLSTGNDIEIEKFTNGHQEYIELSKQLGELMTHKEAKELLQEIDQIEQSYLSIR